MATLFPLLALSSPACVQAETIISNDTNSNYIVNPRLARARNPLRNLSSGKRRLYGELSCGSTDVHSRLRPAHAA